VVETNNGTIMRTFKFYKENTNRWYVDLPQWEGEKDELEMVSGADTFLEILSQGEQMVNVTLSTITFDGSNVLELKREDENIGGGWYQLLEYVGIPYELEMWLCEVTRFVFGELPKKIYFCKN
jgi:hypothetical protein